MTNKKFADLNRYDADEPLNQFHMDVAASIQAVTEEVVLRIAKSLRQSLNT